MTEKKVIKRPRKSTNKTEAREKLGGLISAIYQLSGVAKRAKEERDASQDEAIPLFKLLGETTLVVPAGDVDLQGTLVQPGERPMLNAEAFLKSLSASQRKAVTTLALDTGKLDDAIAKGIITMTQVDEFTDLVPGASAYVKVTSTKAAPR